jgi:hypothetical protein
MLGTSAGKTNERIEHEENHSWFIYPVYNQGVHPRALEKETEAAWEEQPGPHELYEKALAEPENYGLLTDDLDVETIRTMPEDERRSYIQAVLGQMAHSALMYEKMTGEKAIRPSEYDVLHAMIPLGSMGSWNDPEPLADGK